jgi:ribosomal protein S16
MKQLKIFMIVTLLAGGFVISCKHEPIPEPPSGGGGGGGGTGGSNLICFESEVLPIFQSACAKPGCHDAITREEGYVLDSYANIMKKGIVAGKATSSKLYTVLFKSGDDRMPPPPNPGLTRAQSDAIGRWINEGAQNTTNCGTNCDTTVFTFSAAVNPILQNNCVGCHNASTLNGGVNLSTYANVKVYADNGKLYGSIAHLAGYKPMPNASSKLSDCQIRVVQKWIQSGAPNN